MQLTYTYICTSVEIFWDVPGSHHLRWPCFGMENGVQHTRKWIQKILRKRFNVKICISAYACACIFSYFLVVLFYLYFRWKRILREWRESLLHMERENVLATVPRQCTKCIPPKFVLYAVNLHYGLLFV